MIIIMIDNIGIVREDPRDAIMCAIVLMDDIIPFVSSKLTKITIRTSV